MESKYGTASTVRGEAAAHLSSLSEWAAGSRRQVGLQTPRGKGVARVAGQSVVLGDLQGEHTHTHTRMSMERNLNLRELFSTRSSGEMEMVKKQKQAIEHLKGSTMMQISAL